MAESYRGLTIRIGGDTTELQKALRSANGAISQTNLELRNLGRALKLDPANIQNYNLQMGYLANKASNVSMALARLQDAQDEIGKKKIKIDGGETTVSEAAKAVTEYSSSIDNAAAEVSILKTKVNQLNTTLDSMHLEMRELGGDFAEIKSFEISSAIDMASGKKSIADVIKEFEKLGGGVEKTKGQIESVKSSVLSMKDAFVADMNGNFNADAIREVFESLPDVIRPSAKAIDEMVAKINNMADENNAAVLKQVADAERLKNKYISTYDTAIKKIKDIESASNVSELKKLAALESAKAKQDANAASEASQIEALTKKREDAARKIAELTEKQKSQGDDTPEEKRKELSDELAAAEAKRIDAEKEIAKIQNEQRDRQNKTNIAQMEYDNARAKNAQRIADEYASAQSELDDLAQQFADAQEKASASAMDTGKSISEIFSNLKDNLPDLSTQLFNAASGTSDPKFIKQALEDMSEELGLSSAEAERFVAAIESLVVKFAVADQELKDMEQVEAFEDLVTKIQATKAEIESIGKALSNMHAPSQLMLEMTKLTESSKELEQSYKTLMSTGDTLSDMFKANPDDAEAITAAMKAYSAAEQVAVENATMLNQKLASFDADQIADVTDTTKSATKQLIDAAEAAQQASVEHAKYSGELNDARDRLAQLKSMQRETMKSDGDMAAKVEEITAEIDKYEKKVAELTNTVNQTAIANKKAQDALEGARMRKEYEEAAAGAKMWESEVRKAVKASQEAQSNQAVLKVVGDTSEIDRLGEELTAAIGRANALKAAMEFDPTNMELARQKAAAYADAADIAEQRTKLIQQAISNMNPDKLDELREKYGSVSSAVSQTSKVAEDLGVEVAKARTKLESLVSGDEFDGMRADILNTSQSFEGDLTPAVSEARNRLIQLEAALESALADKSDAAILRVFEQMRDAAADTERQFRNLKNPQIKVDDAAFMQAVDMMGQAAERAGQRIVESANTIDSAYRDMRKTVNASEQEFDALRDKAIEFSQTHITSADTILEIESLGGQMGLAASAMQEFGETVSNLDIATDMNADELALKMGQLENVMSDFDDTQFSNAADAVVRLGNNMAAQESSIINVAQRMSSVASVAQMTTPDLFAWSAAIASTGQRSESAATAITNTITGISSAVAAGGKDLKQFASIAGMSADDFAEAWRTNPSDALKAFIEGLANLTDSNTDAITALENMGISSVRQETALLGLTTTVDNLDDALTMSNDAWNGVGDAWGDAGDAAIEAQNKSEGFSGALGVLSNNVNNLSATLGEGLVAPMQVLSTVLSGLTNVLDSMSGPMKTAVVSIGAMVAAAGAVTPVVQTLTKGYRDLYSKIANVITTAKASAEASAVSKAALDTEAASMAANTAATDKNTTSKAANATADAAGAVADGEAAAAEALDTASTTANTAATDANTASKAANATANTALVASLGPVALALTALTFVVGAAISSMADFAQKAEDQRIVTEELGSVMQASKDAYQDYMDEVEKTGNALLDFKDKIDETRHAYAEQVKQMKEGWGDIGVDEAKLDTYVSSMEKLSGGSRLTSNQLAELRNAVRQFNDVTGSSISIIDDETGKLSLNADQLRDVAAAHKEQIEQQKAQEDYNTHLERQRELEDELAVAEKELRDAQDKLSSSQSERIKSSSAYLGILGSTSSELGTFNTATMTATGTIQGYSSRVVDANNRVNELKSELASVNNALDNSAVVAGQAGHQFDTIEAALEAAGVSTKEYSKLSKDEMADVAAAFERGGKTIEALAEALAKYGISVKGFASDAQSAANAAKSISDEMVTEHKRQLEDDYNNLKRSLDNDYDLLKKQYDADYKAQQKAFDAEYKDQQKAYDAEYKAQQKQLDDIYKAQQKAFDKEYKAAQKAYDKKYKEYQKQLDKEYKARQKQLDELYDNYKDKLDDEYDALKDANDDKLQAMKDAHAKEQAELKKKLDALYNQRKKSYDKEYKAYQKANDRQLKELKKSQSKEVDAFKDATSKRIAEIKREYDARKKTLEDTDGTKPIDEQIEALKSQTKAEQDAIKQQEQEEKKAELEKALRQAKTRKTRQEAEKALNDYLAELAQEAREKEREAEIERLEDQKETVKDKLDIKKDALDQERDAVIESYEKQRDIELEGIELTQEEAYEKLKESLDDQNELYKEKNDSKLATYKESLDAQLNALKALHTAEEEEYKKKLDADLAALKGSNDGKLAVMKENHTAELETLKEQQTEKLEFYKENQQVELEAIKENQTTQLEALKASQQEALQATKDNQQAALQALKDSQQAELQALKDWQQAELDAIKQGNEDKLLEKKRANEDDLNDFKAGLGNISAVTDQVIAKETETKDAVTNIRTSLKDILKGLLDEHQISLQEYLNAMNGMPGSLKTIFDEMGINTDTGLQAIAKKMYDEGTLSKEQYNNVMLGLPGSLDAIYTEMGLRTAEKLGMLGNDMGTKAEEGKNKVLGEIKKLETEVPASMDATNMSLQQKLAIASGIYGNGGKEMRKRLKAEVDKTKGDSENAAKNATNAFANGLDPEIVKNAARTKIGDAAKKGVDEGLDINSPSREMEQRGEYTVEGFVNGMEGARSRVETASTDIADFVKSKFDEIDATEYGDDAVDTFARGMDSRTGDVKRSADDVVDSVKNPLDDLDTSGYGDDVVDEYSRAIRSKSNDAYNAAKGVADDAADGIDSSNSWANSSGWDFGNNFRQGLEDARQGIINTAWDIANDIADILHHTTPEKGPLKDDNRWGSDFIQNLIDGMRKRESDLLRQTRRMADIVQDGFDPTLTVDAAYEAIDSIHSGEARRAARTMSIAQGAQSNQTVNVNVSLSDVTIREDADIRKLAEQIAALTRRQSAASMRW